VLTDVSLDVSGGGAFDVLPRKLPDLPRGGQLLVVGRYRAPGEVRVTVSGKVGGERRRFSISSELPRRASDASFLPGLWAVRKVGFLLDEIRRNGEKRELRDEVIALGKKHGIVTPYTSYLVVEDDAPPPPPRSWSSDERSRGEYLLAPGGLSTRGAARAAEPAPAAAPEAYGGGLARGLDAASGAAGVAASQEVKKMKETERREGAALRTASGRTFLLRSGTWRDAAVGDSDRVLVVKWMSAAHLALLDARPELKAAFALGEHVVVGLGDGRAVEVAPDRGTESAGEVVAFLR
jgi:Ca-activated chloride channel family protein